MRTSKNGLTALSIPVGYSTAARSALTEARRVLAVLASVSMMSLMNGSPDEVLATQSLNECCARLAASAESLSGFVREEDISWHARSVIAELRRVGALLEFMPAIPFRNVEAARLDFLDTIQEVSSSVRLLSQLTGEQLHRHSHGPLSHHH